jgi:hypothetical protein
MFARFVRECFINEYQRKEGIRMMKTLTLTDIKGMISSKYPELILVDVSQKPQEDEEWLKYQREGFEFFKIQLDHDCLNDDREENEGPIFDKKWSKISIIVSQLLKRESKPMDIDPIIKLITEMKLVENLNIPKIRINLYANFSCAQIRNYLMVYRILQE